MGTVQSKYIQTSRLTQHYLRTSSVSENTIIFIHGNASSSIFWKKVMEALPDDMSGIAPDLRGFGDTEDVIIDATRGMGDFADDIIALMDALNLEQVHLVGHSMGGSAAFYLTGHHPDRFKSTTFVDPGSPFGFGGTKDPQGTPHTPDFAGSGGGVVNAEFAKKIAKGDRSADDPNASPRVVMNAFYWKPPFVPQNEEELLDGLLSEKVGDERYPGDHVPSEHWPYVAPGKYGPANALSPKYIGDSVNQFISHTPQTPILWIRGADDQIVSDESLFDMGTLGKMGLIPGYPGIEVYPPQPMVSQMRTVLEQFKKQGGNFTEVVIEDAGHTPFIEKESEFLETFLLFIQSHS